MTTNYERAFADRPDVLAVYPSWWRGLADVFGTRFDGVRIDEARYRASYETLERLAASTDSRIRVRIGPWLEERRLYPRNLENLRRFVAAQAAADSAAARAARVRPLTRP